MGQSLSCAATTYEHGFFRAVQMGEVALVEEFLQRDSSVVNKKTVYDHLSSLHIAAANGQIEVLSMILDRSVHPDLLNRNKQTPLMMAAMHGHISCVWKLLRSGANILMFDSLRGRSCLHYAAYHGHTDCLQAILEAARSPAVADSWGFARFVNVKDADGATPLHLAARRRRPEAVHVLLDNGALVSASTGNLGYPGSTPLHLAARSGSLECIRELLAWGADRSLRDSAGRSPFSIALKRGHRACAALLDPTSAEPLVWPSPLKFISELNSEAKSLLERALMEANMVREKKILKGVVSLSPSPSSPCDDLIDDDISEDDDIETCCICFDQPCTIEVQNCGHQMCASCTLALCCHNKPNPVTTLIPAPVCPFCRSSIAKLTVAEPKSKEENIAKLRMCRKSPNPSEGSSSSSSFKNLTAAMGSFGKLGRSSRMKSDSRGMVDKP